MRTEREEKACNFAAGACFAMAVYFGAAALSNCMERAVHELEERLIIYSNAARCAQISFDAQHCEEAWQRYNRLSSGLE